MGGAMEMLGVQLLQNLPISPQQPNVILSPLSLTFALAQPPLGQDTPPPSSLAPDVRHMGCDSLLRCSDRHRDAAAEEP